MTSGGDYLVAASSMGAFHGPAGSQQEAGQILKQLPLSAEAQKGTCKSLGLGLAPDSSFIYPVVASVHERGGAVVGTRWDVFHTGPAVGARLGPSLSSPQAMAAVDMPFRMPNLCKPAVAFPAGRETGPYVVLPSETGRGATVMEFRPDSSGSAASLGMPPGIFAPRQGLHHHPSDLLDIKSDGKCVGLLSKTCLRLHSWQPAP